MPQCKPQQLQQVNLDLPMDRSCQLSMPDLANWCKPWLIHAIGSGCWSCPLPGLMSLSLPCLFPILLYPVPLHPHAGFTSTNVPGRLWLSCWCTTSFMALFHQPTSAEHKFPWLCLHLDCTINESHLWDFNDFPLLFFLALVAVSYQYTFCKFYWNSLCLPRELDANGFQFIKNAFWTPNSAHTRGPFFRDGSCGSWSIALHRARDNRNSSLIANEIKFLFHYIKDQW